MVEVSGLIGSRFERIFLDSFSSFYRVDDDKSIPDFFNGQFWVEAKTGNVRWGPRLHTYQLNEFNETEPIVYAMGLHNFDKARPRLARLKTFRGKTGLLNREMDIVCVYFVNNEIVKLIWEKDWTLSKENELPYCVVKPGFLEGIIHDKKVNRKGAMNISASNYYGIVRDDFLLQSPQSSSAGFDVGVILHREQDAIVINYLQEMGFLK